MIEPILRELSPELWLSMLNTLGILVKSVLGFRCTLTVGLLLWCKGGEWHHDDNRYEELATALNELGTEYIESAPSVSNSGQESTIQAHPSVSGPMDQPSCPQAMLNKPVETVTIQNVSSIRLLLKSVLKQGKESHEEKDSYKKLEVLSVAVSELEERLRR